MSKMTDEQYKWFVYGKFSKGVIPLGEGDGEECIIKQPKYLAESEIEADIGSSPKPRDILKPNDYYALNNLSIYSAVDESTNGTPFASSENSVAYSAEKAFDGNTETYWISTSNANEYIGLSFANAKIVDTVAIQCPSSYICRDFEVQGNNGGGWQKLYEGTKANNTSLQTFWLLNSTAYSSYRIYIKNVYSGAQIRVTECKMFSITEVYSNDY